MPEKKGKESSKEKTAEAPSESSKTDKETSSKTSKKDAPIESTKKEALSKKTPTKKPVKEKTALEKLKEKAKALESSVEDIDASIDLKEKVKEGQEKKDTLVPMEDYLKSSIHLGTRVITPDMKSYVYRRRADGLAVFNTAMLDDKLRVGADYLSGFAPKDVVIVCKREAGWEAVKKFSEATGIKAFTKKYPAGVLTNTELVDFMEAELVFICDPWIDKNALKDANLTKTPVLSICDTNNYTQGVSQIIPGNNKSAKSLGMILHLVAKLYNKKRKISREVPPIQEFVEGWDALVPPK
jgi:small subunit ribosomal protein S2